MEKKKNNKKLFAIIAASALAFVLTVALSVSITLAYFGDTANPKTTITMGQALNFDTAEGKKATATAKLATVLPGANSQIDVTANIAASTTNAYLRVKVDATGTGEESIKTGSFTCADGTFVLNGGYYYLVQTAKETDMQELTVGTGKAIAITIPYTVDKTLKNNVAGQSIEVTITMEIVQSANIGTTLAEVATEWADGTNVG